MPRWVTRKVGSPLKAPLHGPPDGQTTSILTPKVNTGAYYSGALKRLFPFGSCLDNLRFFIL